MPVTAARCEHALLDAIDQRTDDRAVLVDDLHAGLDDVGVGHGRDRREDHVDIVRVQQVVASENRDVLAASPAGSLLGSSR